ncbi:hypothetical protein [Chryseobacterium sp. IT-36CA2]|uniref:hypothetical protein n=1 Tax=Chryseobacterium sp. IT-36CA2 TaxID=3026460 RepID=UPI0039E1521B
MKKNYKIITLFLFILSVQSCFAQEKNSDLNLSYKKIFVRDNKITRSFIYNSKTAIYQVKQLYPDGNYKTKTVTVNLTQKNIKEIHNLYLKLQLRNLHNCTFNDNNELFLSSTISFNKNENVDNLPCNTDWEDKEKYNQIETKLYEFILPTYRLQFPDEYVQK